MSVGTPVLAGNAASLPEVVDGAGRLLDPDDADAWSEAMLELLHDGDERERLIAAGLQRAAAFSWATTARDTLAAYRDAVAGNGAGEAEEAAS
jgi:glycosyltransferase involved in cell wall biosynthesis